MGVHTVRPTLLLCKGEERAALPRVVFSSRHVREKEATWVVATTARLRESGGGGDGWMKRGTGSRNEKVSNWYSLAEKQIPPTLRWASSSRTGWGGEVRDMARSLFSADQRSGWQGAQAPHRGLCRFCLEGPWCHEGLELRREDFDVWVSLAEAAVITKSRAALDLLYSNLAFVLPLLLSSPGFAGCPSVCIRTREDSFADLEVARSSPRHLDRSSSGFLSEVKMETLRATEEGKERHWEEGVEVKYTTPQCDDDRHPGSLEDSHHAANLFAFSATVCPL
ncbi:hypothetical protein QBC43DRAFT_330521 [Cladorrhinum sp. PSN259]|nr:hypothetical protein QBC43DRAFT_330521 [Cladorrhinum sp. PSN259]